MRRSEARFFFNQDWRCSILRTWRVTVPLLLRMSLSSFSRKIIFLSIVSLLEVPSNLCLAIWLFFYLEKRSITAITDLGSVFLNCSPMLCIRNMRISISDSPKDVSRILIRPISKSDVIDWKR